MWSNRDLNLEWLMYVFTFWSMSRTLALKYKHIKKHGKIFS